MGSGETDEPPRIRLARLSVVTDEVEGFASPEDAGLSGWPVVAKARVVSLDVRGDRAEVVVDTEPSYAYWLYCVRRSGKWRVAVSGNGPTAGWGDPSIFAWDG